MQQQNFSFYLLKITCWRQQIQNQFYQNICFFNANLTVIPLKFYLQYKASLQPMEYILGYTCQSKCFPEIKSHNTTTIKYLQSLPKDNKGKYLKDKAHQNLANLKLLLQKNFQRKIMAFRVSNSLIPFGDEAHYDIQQEHKEELKEIGEIANKYNMYLSFHASQYIALNSKRQSTAQNSIRTINFFSLVLKLMNLKNSPNIILHIGGIKMFKDFQEACDQWCKNFQKLSKEAKQCVVVENDQNSHSIDSCMYIHRKVGVPVVFDHAHYDYKPTKGISMDEAMKLAMSTWKDRCPKVHLCSQVSEVKIHNHAEELKLTDFLKVYGSIKTTGVQKCVIMLEARGKDVSLLQLERQIKQYEDKNNIKL